MLRSLTGTWLLDTNILIAFFDAASTHHTSATAVMAQLENGSFQGIVAAQNILELSAVLMSGYHVKKEVVAADIRALIALRNITTIYPNAPTITRYLALLKGNSSLHATDLFLASTMLANSISSIITNDHDFEAFADLTVYDPFLVAK